MPGICRSGSLACSENLVARARITQELEAEILGDDASAIFKDIAHRRATRVEATVINHARCDRRRPCDQPTRERRDGDRRHRSRRCAGEFILADLKADGSRPLIGDLTSRQRVRPMIAVAVVGRRKDRGGDLVESNVRAAMFRKRGGVAAKALNAAGSLLKKGRKTKTCARKRWACCTTRARSISSDISVSLVRSRIGIHTRDSNRQTRLDARMGIRWLGNLDGNQDEHVDHRASVRGLGTATAALARRRAQLPPPIFERNASTAHVSKRGPDAETDDLVASVVNGKEKITRP